MKIALPFLFCAAAFAAEPTATLLENEHVKVIRALEKPHVKGKMHEHKVNRVMIYTGSGTQRFEYEGGKKPETFHWKAGEVKWSPASGMHAPEVTTDEAFNIVEVELKKPAAAGAKKVSGAKDVLKVSPKHYKLEFENDQVRVIRFHAGPHDKIPEHEHALNRVTVAMTDQNMRSIEAAGNMTVTHKAGEAFWGTAKTHSEENLNDKPVELILVELKN